MHACRWLITVSVFLFFWPLKTIKMGNRLKKDYELPFPPFLKLPSHMLVAYGKVQKTSVTVPTELNAYTTIRPCHICGSIPRVCSIQINIIISWVFRSLQKKLSFAFKFRIFVKNYSYGYFFLNFQNKKSKKKQKESHHFLQAFCIKKKIEKLDKSICEPSIISIGVKIILLII